MITHPFEYTRAASLSEALGLLAEGAKPLAGGMSLVPMMKLRLAAPEHLVDLAKIAELRYIREDEDVIRIGAMSTHHDIETSTVLRRACSVLSKTAAKIGDVQIRNSGTIGGSVAHNDPAADYPAALMALDALVTMASVRGERAVPFSEFVLDSFTTALEPDEIIREITVPADGPRTGTAYFKMAQAASGFALAGVAVRLRRDEGGRLTMVRVGVTGVGPFAYRAAAVEAVLEGTAGGPSDVAAAASHAAEGVDASSDMHAGAEY
ncbi:MAG: xanthine dehydrogenase family protein subunit M, partial [Bryobacteraceae bacterium]|nr:xanthine dehydrogenase family protein subunit M [Bryobacteraceae bacterium]